MNGHILSDSAADINRRRSKSIRHRDKKTHISRLHVASVRPEWLLVETRLCTIVRTHRLEVI